MEVITSFAVLGLLVVAGSCAIDRARQYWRGDDVRCSLESLTRLAAADGLTPDERKAVASTVEFRLQQLPPRCVKQ